MTDLVSACHLIVQGKVQGVFYRDWTVATARSLGLAGWVRNLPDGTVEAHVEGEPAIVERMIEAMHNGPPRARVARIERNSTGARGLKEFSRH